MAVVGNRFVLPYQTVIDAAGVPIPGALLNFYLTGTSTRHDTYSNAGLTIANANPVVANGAGMFGNIFLDPSVVYKVVLTDADGDEIWTADPVYGSAAAGGGNLVQKNANYVVADADQIVEANAAGGPFTITIPLTRPVGSPVLIVKTDGTGNVVTISDGGADRGYLIQAAQGAIMQSLNGYVASGALRLL